MSFLELCGAFVVAFGEFQMMHSTFGSLVTTFWPIYPANTLIITGTIVTCVCYLGVLGGMKENRCMLISVSLKHGVCSVVSLSAKRFKVIPLSLFFQFYVLLFILMLVELAMACVFFVYNREVRD